jgi:hypothetical protein
VQQGGLHGEEIREARIQKFLLPLRLGLAMTKDIIVDLMEQGRVCGTWKPGGGMHGMGACGRSGMRRGHAYRKHQDEGVPWSIHNAGGV